MLQTYLSPQIVGVNATDGICTPQPRQKPAAVVVTPNQDEDWQGLDKQVTGLSYWRWHGGLSWKLLPLSGWLQLTTALCELDSSVYKYRYLPPPSFQKTKGLHVAKTCIFCSCSFAPYVSIKCHPLPETSADCQEINRRSYLVID